jgi:broad specificity phosphatase PhoE
VTRVVFIRHGETAWSSTGRLTSRTDIPLEPFGRSEAELLGRSLSRLNPDLVISSPMIRASQTAELLKASAQWECEISINAALREQDFGLLEGHSPDSMGPLQRAQLASWRDPVSGGHPPDGESASSAADRVAKVVREYTALDTVVLVSHGYAIRAGICALLGIQPNLLRSFSIDPAKAAFMLVDADVRLLALNTATVPRDL